jgi:hypothetical protein
VQHTGDFGRHSTRRVFFSESGMFNGSGLHWRRVIYIQSEMHIRVDETRRTSMQTFDALERWLAGRGRCKRIAAWKCGREVAGGCKPEADRG